MSSISSSSYDYDSLESDFSDHYCGEYIPRRRGWQFPVPVPAQRRIVAFPKGSPNPDPRRFVPVEVSRTAAPPSFNKQSTDDMISPKAENDLNDNTAESSPLPFNFRIPGEGNDGKSLDGLKQKTVKNKKKKTKSKTRSKDQNRSVRSERTEDVKERDDESDELTFSQLFSELFSNVATKVKTGVQSWMDFQGPSGDGILSSIIPTSSETNRANVRAVLSAFDRSKASEVLEEIRANQNKESNVFVISFNILADRYVR